MKKKLNYLHWYIELSDAITSGDTIKEQQLTEEGNHLQITYNDMLRVSTALTDVSLNAIDLQQVLQDEKIDLLVKHLVDTKIMTTDQANTLSDDMKELDEGLVKLKKKLEEK